MLIATALGDGHSASRLCGSRHEKVDQQSRHDTIRPAANHGEPEYTTEQYGPNARLQRLRHPRHELQHRWCAVYRGVLRQPNGPPQPPLLPPAGAPLAPPAAQPRRLHHRGRRLRTQVPVLEAADDDQLQRLPDRSAPSTRAGVLKRSPWPSSVDEKAMGSLTADTLKTSIAAAIGATPAVAMSWPSRSSRSPLEHCSHDRNCGVGDMVKTVGGMSGEIWDESSQSSCSSSSG